MVVVIILIYIYIYIYKGRNVLRTCEGDLHLQLVQATQQIIIFPHEILYEASSYNYIAYILVLIFQVFEQGQSREN